MTPWVTWSPQQWMLVLILVAASLVCALTAVIAAVLNMMKHTKTQKMLRATQEELQANTARTEQTVIQLQNTTRAVSRTESSIHEHTTQLETLVEHMRAEHTTLLQIVGQAQNALGEIENLHVVLLTDERQIAFDRELAELKALLLTVKQPAPPPKDPEASL